MQLIENNYLDQVLIYPKAFTPSQCHELYKNHDLREKGINEVSEDNYAHAKRFILNDEKVKNIRQKIMTYVNMANNKFYHFNISYLDKLQLLEYTENCFFDWHIDIAGKSELNSTRKINTLIFLSKPEDYQGGQISFNLLKNKLPEISQEQGTLVLFPSHKAHCVSIITSGVRYSLSAIVNGDTFR